jgi:hypothetical protein
VQTLPQRKAFFTVSPTRASREGLAPLHHILLIKGPILELTNHPRITKHSRKLFQVKGKKAQEKPTEKLIKQNLKN